MKVNTIQLFEIIKNKELKDKSRINWFPKNRDDEIAISLYFDTKFYDSSCIRYKEKNVDWFRNGYWSFDDKFEIIEEEKEIEEIIINQFDKNLKTFADMLYYADFGKSDVLLATKINELIREFNKMKEEGK